jgi:hypothetical protein
MIEIIALIILVISFLGMLVIFWKKIPVLVTLPRVTEAGKSNLFLKVKNKIQGVRALRSFPPEILLQKILSKIRIVSLKIENKTANYLQRMRERSRKEKEKENDNYWQELKKTANRKKKDKNLPT